MSRSRVSTICLSAALAVLFSAAPAFALPPNTAECRRMTRQIEHFTGVAEMAAQRGDEPWFDATVDHVRRLGERRVRLCPAYTEPNYAAIYASWAKEVIKRAAQAFLTYTTFGAF